MEHFEKIGSRFSASGGASSLVGDHVATIAGQDVILAHAHLVVDGNTAHGTAGTGQGVEM